MTPKIIILVSGGTVQDVYSNCEISHVIIDHDNDDPADFLPVKEDRQFKDGEAHQLFSKSADEVEIRNELQRLNY